MPERDSHESLAPAIYGAILSTALIAAYSEDSGSDPLQIAAAVLVAALIFWLAHAYADVLARGLALRERASVSRARTELGREWPMVMGALLPILPLLLAPLGVLSDYGAENAAIISGVALLGLVGALIAWRRGEGLLGMAFNASGSALFGVVVVALKAIVH
jgi:hypothetical protein